MNVGIPIFDVVSTVFLSGVEKYAYSLLTNLIRLDKNSNYYTYHRFRQDPGRFKKFNTRRIIHRFFPNKMQEIAFRRDRIDILHNPVYFANLPYLKGGKTILTIHDLVPIFKPEMSMEGLGSYFSGIQEDLNKVDKIIAVSENTKKDVMKYLKVPAEKIVVIYEGVEEKYKPKNNVSKIKEKYDLDEFILFVGTLEPRKNIPNLIRAFGMLKCDTHKLVIAGKKGWKYEEIFKAVEDLCLQRKVRFMGYIPEEDLPELYSAAELFVYPSLYEGFGLPPLEAMACGTPVITSNLSSLPEVVGDAAILVDPEDTNEIAAAMNQVISDPRLAQEMSDKGLEQARKFSWERCALETLKVYNEVYSKNGKMSSW